MKPYVLVVDDDQMNIDLMSMMLDSLGCSYQTATSGDLALRRFEAECFNIVLLDQNLPDGSGSDVAKNMRRHRPNDKYRILMCSADSIEDAQRKNIDTSVFDGELSKPFSFSQLRQTISNAS